MRAVHLIGVNHEYQLGPHSASPMFADAPSAPFEEFDAFLRSALANHGIHGIAEEMSSEREKHWIKELITFDTFPVLFVLGASHVDTFERLLSDSGFQPLIIARDWTASSDRTDAF